MVDVLKKAGLLTAELVSLTADKVQEVADDFVKKGTLHDSEAKKFVSEVRGKLESREKEILDKWDQVAKSFQQIGDTLGIKPPQQMAEDNLENKIESLEKQLEDLKTRRDVVKKDTKKATSASSTKK